MRPQELKARPARVVPPARPLVALAALLLGVAAHAETITATLVGGANLGTVVRGTSDTTFSISTAGAVTQSLAPTAGGASRLSSATVTATSIRVACSNPSGSSNNDCRGEAYDITVTEASGSGNFVNAMTCTNNSAITTGVALASCTTSDAVATASKLSFRLTADTSGSSSRTWTATIPISFSTTIAATARGNSLTDLVGCTYAGVSGGSASFTNSCGTPNIVTVKVIRNIVLSKTRDLAFGTLVRPRTGSAVIALDAATSARTVSSGAASFVPGSTATSAQFSITGEGGQAINVTIPASVTLTNGANNLTVTTTNNLPGGTASQTLSNSIGSDGTLGFYVGGTLPLTSTTPRGNYAGSFTVTAAYQ